MNAGQVVGDVLSPYLTSEEAGRYLRFPDARCFRQWAKREGLRPKRRGRVLLWERRYIDTFIDRAR